MNGTGKMPEINPKSIHVTAMHENGTISNRKKGVNYYIQVMVEK
jgi:hypothetical protein